MMDVLCENLTRTLLLSVKMLYKNVFQFLVCELCKVNLIVPVKYGSKAPTVPLLFSSTNNKEFTWSLGGETMVLEKLLSDIGISLTGSCDLYSGSVPERYAASIQVKTYIKEYVGFFGLNSKQRR